MGLFCTKCGAKTLPEAKFCGACGNKLSPSTNSFGSNSPATLEPVYQSNTGHPSSAQSDTKVRTLFVIGSQTSRDAENWLKSKFPNSLVMRFSTIGAIREAAKRMYAINQIESLCLLGTAKTVPPGRLHDAGETQIQTDQPFWSLESDLIYVETDIVIHEMAETAITNKGAIRFVNPEDFSKKIGVSDIEGGLIPVGRVPSDDPAFWALYFDSLANFHSPPNACVAVTNFPPSWINETKATLSAAEHSGCNSQSLFALGALHDNELEYGVLNQYPEEFTEGSRIIVNLHGELPNGSSEVQTFTAADSGDPRGEYYFEVNSFNSFPKSILFLFSCYGGNSKWWNSGGAIPHFLGHGGVAAIASSTCVYCSSDGEIVPGATLMCVDFFKNIDNGLNFGDSLKLAKFKTFLAAINTRDPVQICIAVKEIFQFSLFGAPWGVIGLNSSGNISEIKASSSILDKVRNSNSSSALSSIRIGLSELNKIREQLSNALGEGGITYFSQTSNYVMNNLRKHGMLDRFENEMNSMGLSLNGAHFESLVWAKNRFNLVTLKNERRSDQASALIVLDDNGRLLAKMEVKG